MLLWAALLLVPPGYGGPPLTPAGYAIDEFAEATATTQASYLACGRGEDAARVERDYVRLTAEAHAQVPDDALYLRLWQQAAGRRPDGGWTSEACDDWGRDQSERRLEIAVANFRERLLPETARRPQATMPAPTPEGGPRAALRNVVVEADLFARGAIARAMAENMRCGRSAQAEAVEARLLAIERTVPDALYDGRTLADFKYGAGQSRDGSWPRPPTHRCLEEERRALDGDVEEDLRDLGAAAQAYLAGAH
jgi:hypothetical protein